MVIEQILSLANNAVRWQFTAMERSLRAAGCDLPLQVIPYDENLFALPKNASWLDDTAIFSAVRDAQAVKLCRKYAALVQRRCAFFDSDIIHLRDPRAALEPLPNKVFIVADTEWNKARWTFTPETREIFLAESTLWALWNFNSGFFAYEDAPVNVADVTAFLSSPIGAIARGASPTSSEQEGANFLIHQSRVEVVNLCLPPHRMESTMACDYPDHFADLLSLPNRPFFMHFASNVLASEARIVKLFSEFLTREESAEYVAEQQKRQAALTRSAQWPIWARVANRLLPYIDQRFRLHWQPAAGSVG